MIAFFRTILYVPFYNLLIYFAWMFGGSVGWAIIAVTVVIRVLLLPSSLKATKAQIKMQALAPKLAQLKEKFKGDQKKLNEETMKMYKEEGANPLGSCLPLLIQLPIIWILYRVFLIGFDESKFEMLYAFVPQPEHLQTFFFGIDLSIPNLWVLPIIAGALQFVLSYMMQAKIPKNNSKSNDPASMMTKQMMYIFPIITVFIGRSLPAALALYWIVTTLFSIVQQVYVNKTIKNENNRHKFSPQISTNNKTPNDKTSTKKEEPSIIKDEAEKKPDMITKVLKKRQEKKEKKAGVSVTIREKK